MLSNSQDKILSSTVIYARASGKTILVGEHAVVYGHRALAMALPDIELKMTLCAFNKENTPYKWVRCWHTLIHDKEVLVEERINELLVKAFEKALSLLGVTENLNDYYPQKILIDSQIPLGGGMGGSAAMSTCLLRIAAQIASVALPTLQEIEYANEIDSLFHGGKASGLDVSAVASNGVIEFQKGKGIQKIMPLAPFWIALIDSKERAETATMVAKVKQQLEKNSHFVEDLFLKLDQLASQCKNLLEQGLTKQFAQCLSLAHEYLIKLGVSTVQLDDIVTQLLKHGALGAKLTGAGGGGLVLSVFENEPHFLYELFGKEHVYLCRI